jgi:hypothetical protein
MYYGYTYFGPLVEEEEYGVEKIYVPPDLLLDYII